MYNEEGETIWERSLDVNGKVQEGNHKGCPFMYQGQYYDEEVELAYNRFRYYDPKEGRYISQDPIGLASGEDNFYSYVEDTNTYIDTLGLARIANKLKPNRDAYGSHSTFAIDYNGNIYKYETYEMGVNKKGEKYFKPTKRFDGGTPDGSPGAPHLNKDGTLVPTPHINHKKGDARIPKPEEMPNNNRFRNNTSYNR